MGVTLWPVDLGGWVRAVAIGLAFLAASWAVLVVLAARLPPGTARELAGLLPNGVRAARTLARDPRVPRRAKVAVALAGLWCLSPIDLVPEFLPVIGPLDDAVVLALTLRYAARRVPRDVLVEAWPGDPRVLDRLLGPAGRPGSSGGPTVATVPDKRNDSKQRRAARNRASREALAARRDNVASAPASPSSTGGGTGRAADVLSILTTPAQIVMTKVHRGAVSLWVGYREWRTSWSENDQLRAENERLRVQSLQVAETRDENDRLRRLLGLRQRLPMTTLTGEVIAREGGGWVRSLTVNRGAGEGIATQTPVIVPDGLVGRVVRVRPGASVVQLINDPASTVGAMVQRTRTPGLVEGDPGGSVRFKYMARDGAGIVVGDIQVDRGSALFHFAVLAPVVDFARVEEVLLLTGQTTQDLAVHFARES
jgi:cell shape-determining protein MreC/uncharacterized membrane protein YkvA (DUF1232 family)